MFCIVKHLISEAFDRNTEQIFLTVPNLLDIHDVETLTDNNI